MKSNQLPFLAPHCFVLFLPQSPFIFSFCSSNNLCTFSVLTFEDYDSICRNVAKIMACVYWNFQEKKTVILMLIPFHTMQRARWLDTIWWWQILANSVWPHSTLEDKLAASWFTALVLIKEGGDNIAGSMSSPECKNWFSENIFLSVGSSQICNELQIWHIQVFETNPGSTVVLTI